MSRDILKKVRHELGLLLMILAISLGISSAMVSDGARAFGVLWEISSFLTVIKISEFIVGLPWLFLTLKIFREYVMIGRRHKHIFFKLEEEREVSRLLRDLIAFYRGYYGKIRTILLLSVLIGLSMIVSAIYSICLGLIETEEFYFYLLIGTVTSAFSLTAFLFIREKWGKKLLKIKSEERILQDFLGEIN